MAVDLKKPITDSGGFRLEKVGGLWTYFNKNGEQLNGIPPQKSLVAIIRQCRNRMGFYHFSGELRRWGVTIQDCYNENKWETLYALEDSIGYMVGSFLSLGTKFHQYRQSIERIHQCEGLDPELERMLSGFLKVWDSLEVPAQ